MEGMADRRGVGWRLGNFYYERGKDDTVGE